MNLYIEAAKFSYKAILAYPTENFGYLIRKLVNLFLLMIFWFAISRSNPEIFNYKQMIAYFLISDAVNNLSFSAHGRFGRDIQKMIKYGKLSSTLIKPVKTLNFLFASFIGGKTSVTIFELIALSVGLYIFPPSSWSNVPLFIIAFLLSAVCGMGMNIYIATIGFYTPEATSIHNVYTHIHRILSGSLIPLSYFPQTIKIFAYLTPFPVFTYFPAAIIQGTVSLNEILLMLVLSTFWALVLYFSANYFWTKALKNYDGVGI